MLDNKSQQKNKDLQNYIKLLSDEQKVKLWIKTLISVQSSLPEIIKSVDRIIEVNASSLSFATDIYNAEKSTMSQVEKVIDLTERKNKLLNVYLISKNLLQCLCSEDKTFIKRKFVFNWTAEELALDEQISIRTVFRKTDKILDKIYDFTKRKNWSLGFILSQVKNESWINEKFNRHAKDSMNTSNPQERKECVCGSNNKIADESERLNNINNKNQNRKNHNQKTQDNFQEIALGA